MHVFLILLFVKWAIISVQAPFISILQFTKKGDTVEHRLPWEYTELNELDSLVGSINQIQQNISHF